MDERWDNDLNKRIKKVFDNYEDTSADEGWQLLREKYPEKEKSRLAGWLWLGSAAALLLLFIGIFWYKTGNNNHEQQLARIKHTVKPGSGSQIAASNNKGAHRDSMTAAKPNNQATSVSSQNTIAKNPGTNTVLPAPQGGKNAQLSRADQNNIAQNTNTKHRKNNSVVPANPSATPPSLVMAKIDNNPAAANQTVKPDLSPAGTGNNTIASIQSKKDQNAQNVLPNNAKVDTGSKSIAANNKPGVNMKQEQAKKQHSIFDDDNNLTNNQKPDAKAPKNGKAVRFGIYAATYVNYAKGSNNQFNVGAGLTSDIRLSENLKLSTGVSIGQNSLSYTNQVPATPSAATNDFLAAASYSPASPRALYTENTPQFKSYDASLIGLDIPLNLKYVFDPEKSNTYILAGVSSGTFISETYTYSFNNPSLFTANLSQVQNQSTNDSFNSFYFARTLNIAFGTGYKLGNNQLTIEPFLKYPLEGLGTQELKFGAGGINLKFDFIVKKK